mmetsp:Transcript_14663/g.59878  ORF Transcript_14663/g.59878 Transcript_14663/m.59878 type:complete len:201 (-) Transcript_14663:1110-1712(-)
MREQVRARRGASAVGTRGAEVHAKGREGRGVERRLWGAKRRLWDAKRRRRFDLHAAGFGGDGFCRGAASPQGGIPGAGGPHRRSRSRHARAPRGGGGVRQRRAPLHRARMGPAAERGDTAQVQGRRDRDAGDQRGEARGGYRGPKGAKGARGGQRGVPGRRWGREGRARGHDTGSRGVLPPRPDGQTGRTALESYYCLAS